MLGLGLTRVPEPDTTAYLDKTLELDLSRSNQGQAQVQKRDI